jgi:hypothetical protein
MPRSRVRDTSCMHLTLRSLTVLSPHEVDIALADDAGNEATFRFSLTDAHGIWCINGESAFSERYRLVPGPSLPMWPEQLAYAALKAVREPFPDDEALARLNARVQEKLARKWRATASERARHSRE